MVPNLSVGEAGTEALDRAAEHPGALYSSVRGEGPSVLLLHGLFGMGSNLGGLARSLAGKFTVHSIDLPNHGRSDWTEKSGIEAMANAVGAYIETGVRGAPVGIVGHSLGGKVAMQLALRRPELVAALVTADIAPVEYAPSHQRVFAAIDSVASAKPGSRREAVDIMRGHLDEEQVAQFLALSLERDDQGLYRWRFNAQGLRHGYSEFLRAPRGENFNGPALSVYGEESDYVDESGKAAMRRLFPEAQFFAVAGAGHWLHAEEPAVFNRCVNDFMKQHLQATVRADAAAVSGQ